MRRHPFTIYQAMLPDGSVYIGRTGSALGVRISFHESDASAGSLLPLHVALRAGVEVKWSVLFECYNKHRSMAEEIKAIKRTEEAGVKVLNLTRGGFYDPYDAGVKKAKRAPYARRRGYAWLVPKES